MNCPKGYQMGSNGVCQQVGGYARGGRIGNDNSTMGWWANDCNDCIDGCLSQFSHCNGCHTFHPGANCNCNYMWNQMENQAQYCCYGDTSSCIASCSGICMSGPRFGGGYSGESGGQGSSRRMGGRIRRRRRRR